MSSCSSARPSARGRPRSRWAGSGPRSPMRTTSSSGCGACARSRPSPTGSVSTSASARSATSSCAGPRPSWRRWRPASGCRTGWAATAGWSPRPRPLRSTRCWTRARCSAPRSRLGTVTPNLPGWSRATRGPPPSSGCGAASTPRSSSSSPMRPVPIRSGPSGDASLTGTVIIAAGAWSMKLGAMLGVQLPVQAIRRQVGFTPQLDRPHPEVPFTLDLSTTLYFHNYRNGLLLGISNLDEDPGFCREFSYGWTRAFDAAAAVVAPSLVGQPLVGGWAGLYENTPDHNALIGKASVPGVSVRHRFLGPRLPAGSGRRRDHPGPVPGQGSVSGPDGVQRGPVRHRRPADRGPHHLM